MVKDQNKKQIPVPCGRCPQCYKRRISGWSFRLMQEEKVSESAYFITLTYDTDHVPITRNGFMDLSKRDCQLFIKRLRKAHENLFYSHKHRISRITKPIKYYLCGEYGGKTHRPHYHAIIFNAIPELIDKEWKNGTVHYGQVSGASVGYTLKYMSKKAKIPMHRNDDRTPEFSLMSKGLGLSYVNDKTIAWHHNDLYDRMYLNIEGGKKIAMPRYIKDKIYQTEIRSILKGYWKGKMERENDELIMSMTETEKHNLVEAHKAQFRKMNKQSSNRQKL